MYIKYQYLTFFTSLLFGSFGVLAFSPYNFWPASIISCTNLLICIMKFTWKKVIWHATFWGIGFFGNGIYWIYNSIILHSNIHCCISFFLIVFLVLYLTLFPMLFSIILANIIKLCPNLWIIAIFSPILWSIIEYLRSNIFTGFPWLQFGYTQIDGPLKGVAPIFGVEGITFIIILISALLAFSIKKTQFLPLIISISIFLLLYPLKWIKWYDLQSQNAVYVSLVQGNIDQRIKWNSDYADIIIKTYLQHTFSMLGKKKIIVWPESAIPGNEIDYNNFLILLDSQLRKYQINLITGIIGVRYTNVGYCFYNSIIVLGNSVPYEYFSNNRYDKHHLVLFSEKFPLQIFFFPLLKIFNLPISCMQEGLYLQPQLNVSNIKITSVICYEIILGHQVRNNFKFNTDFLLTIANNAWFGDSIGPWQHFQMARMRALELGRPLLCSTNNGITAIVNADGTIQAQLPQFVSKTLNTYVTPTTGMTLYAKFGCWLFWCYNIAILIALITFNIKKIKKIIL